MFSVGGRVFFKGRVIETLLGDPSLALGHLLIVNYPSGQAFLDLLANRYFQVVSVLRMFAVRDFSFVLHRRTDGAVMPAADRPQLDPTKAYAILHFRSSRPFSECMRALEPVLASLTIHFASERAVTVATEDNNADRREMPYITNNFVLLEADAELTLKQVVSRDEFASVTADFDDVFLATIRRTV